jgi:hypothetical protein
MSETGRDLLYVMSDENQCGCLVIIRETLQSLHEIFPTCEIKPGTWLIEK